MQCDPGFLGIDGFRASVIAPEDQALRSARLQKEVEVSTARLMASHLPRH